MVPGSTLPVTAQGLHRRGDGGGAMAGDSYNYR